MNLSFLKFSVGLIALAETSSALAMSTTYTSFTPRLDLNVSTITVCSVGAPSAVSLQIDSADPGATPTPVSDDTSTYAISTNVSTALSAQGTQLPEGIDFFAQFGSSGSLTAIGPLQLNSATSGSAGNVVVFNSILPGTYSGTVSYTASAPISTNPFANQSFPVEYSLQ